MDPRIINIIKAALQEDGYLDDVTTNALISPEIELTGHFIAKSSGIVSGIDVVQAVFHFLNANIAFTTLKTNGAAVNRGTVIAYLRGPMIDILKGERVALNILQRMSGIATATFQFVQEIHGTNCQILDTRKTAPLLRILDKQAVIAGGGHNHRFNLSDRILIKDNHIAAVGSIKKAVEFAAKHNSKGLLIEVEVENKEEFLAALRTECDIIMLDNMSVEAMQELVELNQGKKLLEASGNITLKRARSIAATGVNFISVGGLTHSVKALDISLRFSKISSN